MTSKSVAWALRFLGVIDMLAFLAAIMPRRLMEAANLLSGLGELPPGPLVGYLARSASALYGLHGAMIFFISFDVHRYWRLITFLAAAALVHGLVMLGIDLHEGMPRWWTIFEPPGFAATGGIVLILQGLSNKKMEQA
ncbi:MAG: hypothetical protein ACJ8FY_04435 [Gemmataceae bacterium]